ncbi:MAG: hypothetical protein E7342_03950 [Clostridiales bacterium]|nr:hypothetical protein [Clostridiales bacterium]
MKGIFENLLTENIFKVEKKIETIIRTDIEASEIDKILELCPSLVLIKKEQMEKKIKYTARISYFVVYLSNGEIKKVECASEFSGTIENEKDYNLIDIELCLLKTSTDTYGGDLKILSNVSVTALFEEKKELPFLTDMQNLIVKKDALVKPKKIGCVEKPWVVEEEFDLNFSVKEVLLYTVDCAIKSVKCGIGSIILDGELFLSLSLLQKVENSDILKERKNIPFRVELECEDALPEMVARGKVTATGVKIEALVDETTGKSTIKADLNLNLFAEAFEIEEVSYIVDCFSKEKETEIKKEKIEIILPLELRENFLKINTKCSLEEEIPLGARIMSVAGEKISIVSFEEEDGLTVNGVVSCTAFFKSQTVDAVKIEAPFTVNLEKSKKEKVYSINGAIESIFVKALSLKEIEVNLTANFSIFLEECVEKVAVTDLTFGEDKKEKQSAISVYIAKEGEELFDMAKRLNSSMEDITKINDELSFPLKGDERIIIFRQERK